MKTYITLLFSIALLFCGSYESSSQTYTDLHDFNCTTEGCNPQFPAVLAQGRDGNLYGTMAKGGVDMGGTFFGVTPNGTVTAVYNFDTNVGDGNTPLSGVTLGWTDGKLYGTTEYNSIQNSTLGPGTIFQITQDGKTISFMHSFTGQNGTTCPSTNKPDGGNPFAPPIQATNNLFYGVTTKGTAYSIGVSGGFKALCSLVSPSVLVPFGALSPVTQASNALFYGTSTSGNGTVFRFSSSGATIVVHSFELNGADDGSVPKGPVIQASDGKLYGTTFLDFTRQSGEVFRMTLSGAITIVHAFDRFSAFASGYSPVAGLLEATDGNLYGSTEYGGDPNCGPFGKGCGVLFKLTKAGAYTVLHTFHSGEAGQPQATQFQHTNGKIYGLLNGPNYSDGGAIYSLDIGAQPFVRLRTTSGKAGQVIPILGYQLTGTTHVKFGTGDATFTVVADGWITAVVPVNGTTGSITVVTPSRTLASSKPFKVIPTITSINPTSGAVGSQVVITGTGLTQVSKVTFGGVKATVFTVNSATQVTATVPVGAITGKIVVTTPGGSGSSPVIFTVTS